MTTVVKLKLQGTYAFRISFVRLIFFLLVPRIEEGTGKRGGNINNIKELAAERTKYCSLVTLETPFLRKQASLAPLAVSSMKQNGCSVSSI